MQKKTTAKKTTWEDDDESSDEGPQVVAPQPKNENKKAAPKAKSKKDLMNKLAKNASADEPVDPIAQKLELQRLVEEGDLALTEELFGSGPEAEEGSVSNPKTRTEFEALGEVVGNKLKQHGESIHLASCLKALLRATLENSSSQVCKEIGAFCNTQSSEKAKKEKEEKMKGKKTKTKAKLATDHSRAQDDFMDVGLGHGGGYGDAGFDDGDFM